MWGPATLREAALGYWFGGVMETFVLAALGHHKVTVALWELAFARFGMREELLEWRPELSSVQWEEREDRPEWQVRVTTAEGKTLVKLEDGEMFEPEDAKSGRQESGDRSQETGVRRQESDDRSQETGARRQQHGKWQS